MYPERICPTCRKTFTPKHKRQVYDTDYCRVKASRERRKDELAPVDRTGMLDEIRKTDPETARDIESLARKAGIQIAEEMLFICYRAMNRAAIRHAKNVLLESGEVRPKRRSKPKNP